MATDKKQSEQLPPHDLQAEQAVLGSGLVEPQAAGLLLAEAGLTREDFYSSAHQVIFQAMCAVYEQGPLDLVTLRSELARRGALEAAGGAEYLLALINAVPTAAHVLRYAAIVRQKSLLRRLIAEAAEDQARGYEDLSEEGLEEFLRGRVERAQALHDLACPPVAETASLADLGAALRETSWLWPGWVPKGHLSVLGGETGAGKSITALYLSLAATGQFPWPDQTPPPPEGGSVLWVDTEGRQGVTYQRVAEWGLDPACIVLPGADGLGEIDLARPGTAAQIGKQAVASGAGLVVIDSLSGGHSLDENSAVLRVFLKECQQAARDNNLALLLVHHAAKRGQLQPPEMTLDRLRGSSTISQFAVSVLALDRPDAGSKRTRLHSLKLSLGKTPEPLGFRFDGGSFPLWGTAPEKPVVLTPDERARQFLLDFLKTGRRLARDGWREAEGAGIGERAVRRAHAELGVRFEQEGSPPSWWWSLP